jgi:spectinomycin phosphotransferase
MSPRRAIPTGVLIRLLGERFGLSVTRIEAWPGGQDEEADVRRVWTADADASYVVKVRPTGGSAVSARVARYLSESGLDPVVAPVPAADGDAVVEVDGAAISVYPFVDGRTAVEVVLTGEQWRGLGAFTRRLHETRLPKALEAALERDPFRPREIALARRVDRAVVEGTLRASTLAGPAAALWEAERWRILPLVERTERFGARMRRGRLPRVLTHGDLHTWNILVDGRGSLRVIDWDEVRWAPRERDLMFFVGGISAELVGPDATARFLEGYGDPDVDALALAYYRHAWATQDIALYAARVLLAAAPDVAARDVAARDVAARDEAARAEAARILRGLFRPGGIVELAEASLADLRGEVAVDRHGGATAR